jgi:hypothetical protein
MFHPQSLTRIYLVGIISVLLVFLAVLFLLVQILAGGNLILFFQLLIENHFQIFQWIADSF